MLVKLLKTKKKKKVKNGKEPKWSSIEDWWYKWCIYLKAVGLYLLTQKAGHGALSEKKNRLKTRIYTTILFLKLPVYMFIFCEYI